MSVKVCQFIKLRCCRPTPPLKRHCLKHLYLVCTIVIWDFDYWAELAEAMYAQVYND